MITMSGTGPIIRGHILDNNVKAVEEALKRYDPQLYVKWNPLKYKRWGCWEVRRRSNEKEIVSATEFKGATILRLEYHENNFVNHILDVPFMNYEVVNKIKAMDTWKGDHWWHTQEYALAKKQDETEAKAMEEMKYNIRYNRKALKDFMEMVRSGQNPAQIITSTKWVYNQ